MDVITAILFLTMIVALNTVSGTLTFDSLFG